MTQPTWLLQEKRRLRLVKKLVAVHLKGGACALCGNRELEDLEFHHPSKDREYEGGLTTLSFKQVFEEMSKVLLLCSTCHSALDGDRRSKNYLRKNESENSSKQEMSPNSTK